MGGATGGQGGQLALLAKNFLSPICRSQEGRKKSEWKQHNSLKRGMITNTNQANWTLAWGGATRVRGAAAPCSKKCCPANV